MENDDDGDLDRKPAANRRSSHQGDGGPPTKLARLGGAGTRDVLPETSSAGKYDEFASVHFADIRFFDDEENLGFFKGKVLSWKKNEKKPHVVDLRVTRVHELYLQALARVTNEAKNFFFSDNIPACDGQVVLQDFYEWTSEKGFDMRGKKIENLPRIFNVDFQIKGTRLSHTYDLECLSERITHILACHENHDDRALYVGPYFCFVQSSGMGKTKLLYEYTRCSWEKNKVASFLIIPPVETDEDTQEIFHKLDLASVGPQLPAHATEPGDVHKYATDVAAQIYHELDDMLLTLLKQEKDVMEDVQKVALLFDESQDLLKREFGYVAFRFRCVRHWLMENPDRKSFRNNLTVVAVFAGTNSQLTDYHFEDDGMLAEKASPSRVYRPKKREYFEKGWQVHSPFCQTTTLGSCLDLLPPDSGLIEYERAVYYGRPLFAHMAKKGELEKNLPSILLRMLNGGNWTENNRNGWINLLSTRVQLGQPPTEVASYLVANNYANLFSYNDESRAGLLGYFADPVTARLAMMMMDDSPVLENAVGSTAFKGESKGWWTEKLMEIVSTGMASSDKDDFGEVVVALYMLFCGDVLRKLINDKHINKRGKRKQPYNQFSVSLDTWLQLLLSGGTLPDAPILDDKVEVGFIQVCRNHLRSYGVSWKCLQDPSFLKYIYESGIAFYTFDNCPLIDMVVPLRIKSKAGGNINGYCYVPMLVSIKCHRDFSQRQAETECWEMKQKAAKSDLKRALCLLVVFGSEEDAKPFDSDIAIVENTTTKVSDLLMTSVVAKAIRVPTKDEFGLAAAFDSMVSSTQVKAEIFAAHNFLKAHGPSAPELKAEKALREKSLREFEAPYTGLRSALTKPTPRNTIGVARALRR